MAEQCRLCGAPVRVADAAHVMLNAPEVGVRDHYVCSTCYEESVEPLFASGEDAADADDGRADPGPRDDGADDVPAPE